jgi:hypothetical protein
VKTDNSSRHLITISVDSATVMEIDHDARQVFSETMRVLPDPPDVSFLAPSQDAVAARITSPVVTTYIDTEKIAFERYIRLKCVIMVIETKVV